MKLLLKRGIWNINIVKNIQLTFGKECTRNYKCESNAENKEKKCEEQRKQKRFQTAVS